MSLALSGPPQDLSVINIDVHEMEISWKSPQFPNGIITGFTVSISFISHKLFKTKVVFTMQVYYDSSVLVVSTSSCDVSTLWCSTAIVDLAPYTTYTIKVSCSTGAGEGPPTNAISVTTIIGSMFHNYIKLLCK